MITPDPVQIALVTLSALSLTLAALAFAASRRRRPVADRDATALRLDALAERVDALESRVAAGRAMVVNFPTPVRPTATVRRVDRAEPNDPAGPVLIAVPNLAAAGHEPSPTGEAPSDLGRRFATIWELADEGTPPEAIARATGQPIGQVELILGLKRRQPATGGPRLP